MAKRVQYIRKIIRVRAEDSPNVRYAMAQKKQGVEPTGEQIVPGVLDWHEYLDRRRLWDEIRQCIGLDGQFWKGKETLLFPPDWLNASEQYADQLIYPRVGTALGIDTAEGGDDTVWTVVDEKGLIYLEAEKTTDTSTITGKTLGLMREYGIDPENVVFDQGGGGQEHVDRLRSQGYPVSAVSFGSAVKDEYNFFSTLDPEKETVRQVFKNKRAEMYYRLRQRMDPDLVENPFAIPAKYSELRRQLSPVPLLYDEEGRIWLPPKQRKSESANSTIQTIKDMLGCSPDHSDSLVLAIHGLNRATKRQSISVMF